MTDAQRKALANIRACHKALEPFFPIASPTLMQKLQDAVDEYDAEVREANGIPGSIMPWSASHREFFASLSAEEAREYLNPYTVEEIRQLWENGAFGKGPIATSVKGYMLERIMKADRLG